MLLAIDVGNTNTVFALFKEDAISQSWRCKTESSRSGDEYAVFLSQLFAISKTQWSEINNVIVSSVVPDANFHIELLCKNYIKKLPTFVDINNAGININLDQPSEVGADRIVNAAAVLAHYTLPAIVIDFGTATTFDVIDEKGTYCGGVIAPGIRLSIEALTRQAAKLPKISIEKPNKVIGKNTLEAMQSGMYWGYIGLIEGITARIIQEMNFKPTVIATGGLSPLYASSTKTIDIVDENLILKGLLEIQNKKRVK